MDLDPRNLGSFVASALNAKRYRVLLVHPSAGLTVDALQKNPDWTHERAIAVADAADQNGAGEVSLGGLQKQIKEKIRKLDIQHGASLQTFVVGFPESGAHKAVAGPTLRLDWNVI